MWGVGYAYNYWVLTKWPFLIFADRAKMDLPI